MKNIFEAAITQEVIGRINNLSQNSQPRWGKMSVGQMLAHCSVTYEMIFEPERFSKPNGVARFMIKLFFKQLIVGEKPYKKNSRTSPDFLITDQREFEVEKEKLIDFLEKTQALGANHFDQKESNSFGKLSVSEWNIMFYKHLDHHLNQFGV